MITRCLDRHTKLWFGLYCTVRWLLPVVMYKTTEHQVLLSFGSLLSVRVPCQASASSVLELVA